MAIKGKGKTRGRRAPAPAPRPVLVVRKPPLVRRRWFLITLASVVVVVIAAVVVQSVRSSHHRAFLQRQKDAVSLLSDRMTSNLPTENQSIGQGTVFLFPNLVQELDNLSGGQTKPEDSLVTEKSWAADAQKAETAIQAINMSKSISTDFTAGVSDRHAPGLTTATASDAQFLVVQALKEYLSAFSVWAQAAAPDVSAADRKALVDSAKNLGSQADALFSRGWGLVGQLRNAVGLPLITQFPTPPPSPAPSASASPSGSASPSPSPSGSPSPSASATAAPTSSP